MQMVKNHVNDTSCYTISFMYLINIVSVNLALTVLFYIITHLHFVPPDSNPA